MEVNCINPLFFYSAALSIPQELTLIDNSIQSTSVAFNWAPVDDICAIDYVVSVYANGTSVTNTTTLYNNYTIDGNIANIEYCVTVATQRTDGTVGTSTSQLCITLASKCFLHECINYDINNNILRLYSNDLKIYIYNIIDSLLFNLSLQHLYQFCLMNLLTH